MRTGSTNHNAFLAAQKSVLTLKMYMYICRSWDRCVCISELRKWVATGWGVVRCFDVDVNNVFSSQQVRTCSTMGVVVVCGDGGGRGHVSIPLRLNL